MKSDSSYEITEHSLLLWAHVCLALSFRRVPQPRKPELHDLPATLF